MFYRQCRLRKPHNEGYIETVSFIPEKYAKVNKILSLKDDNGNWTHDWVVMSAGSKVPAKIAENLAHKSDDIWTATSGKYPRGNK